MVYLLDSDVFIRAKNDHYGFDFCPGFWDWLEIANSVSVTSPFQMLRAEGVRLVLPGQVEPK